MTAGRTAHHEQGAGAGSSSMPARAVVPVPGYDFTNSRMSRLTTSGCVASMPWGYPS